jgi:SAM-dependent methyltransferase
MSEPYLLGHDEREWDRLREQHALWGPALLGDLARAGVGPGQRLLEVGCGTGELLADLARLAGGRAEGIERDAAAAALAAARPGAEVRVGDLRIVDLGGPYDAIVARWVLSFLPDPAAVVARLAGALGAGGLLAVHDYDHDALGVFPRRPAVQRVIEAFRAAYRDSGGDLWVAGRLPGAFRAAGLAEIEFVPHVRAGPPGSPVWRWVERFLHEHVHTVVASGHLTPGERAAFEADWAGLVADPEAVLFSPLQVTVLGRAVLGRAVE